MNSSPIDLKDKKIWVIGGAGYLGRPVVKLLADMGAKVICADINGRAAQFISGEGLQNVVPVNIDTSDEISVNSFVNQQVSDSGVPQGLVNMSFASTAKAMEDLTGEDFNRVNGTITSTFLLSRAVGSLMVESGMGSIVHFGSMYGIVSPNPDAYEGLGMNKNPVEYGSGKAAIIQMTRYMAVHWGRKNVRCNSISPGPFPNPDVQAQHPEFIARLSAKVPMGRVGIQHEIAGTVAFLLSDASSFITGQNISVDGGWTIW
jgi:NAD(P)-dependent dehydrogenase (short-subunit alcohol dehydrogenase family)